VSWSDQESEAEVSNRHFDRDPDSNRLELQVDAMPVDAANMYIASPAFAANPLGFVVDPETLLAEVTP
jgi:hypothetical protein